VLRVAADPRLGSKNIRGGFLHPDADAAAAEDICGQDVTIGQVDAPRYGHEQVIVAVAGGDRSARIWP
jgi:hypothetical protein